MNTKTDLIISSIIRRFCLIKAELCFWIVGAGAVVDLVIGVRVGEGKGDGEGVAMLHCKLKT